MEYMNNIKVLILDPFGLDFMDDPDYINETISITRVFSEDCNLLVNTSKTNDIVTIFYPKKFDFLNKIEKKK